MKIASDHDNMRFSMRSTLHPVFSEMDLWKHIEERNDIFSMRINSDFIKRLQNERAKYIANSEGEPSEEFNEVTFIFANNRCFEMAMNDVHDQMIESNIAVLNSKETIKEARKKIQVIKSIPFETYDLIDHSRGEIFKYWRQYKDSNIYDCLKNGDIHNHISVFSHYFQQWHPIQKLYIWRLEDQFFHFKGVAEFEGKTGIYSDNLGAAFRDEPSPDN